MKPRPFGNMADKEQDEGSISTNAPLICKFAYIDYKRVLTHGKITTKATCSTCKTPITGQGSTTSDYITHVKTTHKEM